MSRRLRAVWCDLVSVSCVCGNLSESVRYMYLFLCGPSLSLSTCVPPPFTNSRPSKTPASHCPRSVLLITNSAHTDPQNPAWSLCKNSALNSRGISEDRARG